MVKMRHTFPKTRSWLSEKAAGFSESAPYYMESMARFSQKQVCFEYEFYDDSGQWYRACGNENWEFDELGYMKFRSASINDLPIKETERKFRWDRKI